MNKHTFCASLLLAGLAGCTTTPDQLTVPNARLATETTPPAELTEDPVFVDENARQGGLRTLSSNGKPTVNFSGRTDLSAAFSTDGLLTLAIDEMPGKEFLHTVFGEQLGVSYILADNIAGLDKPFTLNLQEGVSPKRMFQMVQQVLVERDIEVTLRDGVYFIHPKDPQQQNATLGFGRSITDVPLVGGTITQVVPIKFQNNANFTQAVSMLSGAGVTQLQTQSALVLTGTREVVVKGVEVVALLDTPIARGRHIAMLELTYTQLEPFLKQMNELLASEGLSADIGKAGDKNIALIPLEQIGSVAIFASEETYLSRVEFWAQQLDKPNQSNDKEYYIYHPKFARAADLGGSVGALFGGSSNNAPDRSRDNSSAFGQNGQAGSGSNSLPMDSQGQQAGSASQAPSSVQSEDLTMTVDPRSNTLIFYTTGKKYQSILPMIKRLDVLPKQILLEATIAEVTLTDDFKMGFEFAVRNGKFGWSTVAATEANKIGGGVISYIDGVDRLLAAMIATNSNINILSNPSIVVRDGVAANLTVGDDIPTLGGTTFNDDTGSSRQDIVRRKTGINLSVIPTISAQGLVVLQIQQQSSDAKGEGNNPIIFERSLSTEVIAQSGQTVMLGGVMSENVTKNFSKVPLLADLPLLGHLFQRESENKVKKELVLLITPKVLGSTDQWLQVRQSLSNSLQLLRLSTRFDENVVK